MKKFKVSLSIVILIISLMFSSTVFASVPNGYVLIGIRTAYNLNYANDSVNADKIRDAVVNSYGSIFVKNFEGKWINNTTNQPFEVFNSFDEDNIEIFDENSEKIKKVRDVTHIKSNDITKIVFRNDAGKSIVVNDKDKVKTISDYLDSINVKRSSSQPVVTGYLYAINIYNGETTSASIILGPPIQINGIYYDIMNGAKIDDTTEVLKNYINLIKLD